MATGKATTVSGLEFGEKVLWRKKRGEQMAKLRSRWAYGIFVGVRRKSGELWVSSRHGEIVKVRAVKRIPEEDRWSSDCAAWATYTPWNKHKDDPEADGDIPEERLRIQGEQERQEAGGEPENSEEKVCTAPLVHDHPRGCREAWVHDGGVLGVRRGTRAYSNSRTTRSVGSGLRRP